MAAKKRDAVVAPSPRLDSTAYEASGSSVRGPPRAAPALNFSGGRASGSGIEDLLVSLSQDRDLVRRKGKG